MKTLGERKKQQILVGFAAETENVIENGRSKLDRKNLDYIIVNDVTDPDGGFGNETNVVTLLSKNGTNTVISRNVEKRTCNSFTRDNNRRGKGSALRMIAEVIVDVAAYPIDRPFDYIVPEPLQINH